MKKEYRLLYSELNGTDGVITNFQEIGIKPVNIYAGIKCEQKNLKHLSCISKRLKCDKLQLAQIDSLSDEFLFFKEARERELLERLKKLVAMRK